MKFTLLRSLTAVSRPFSLWCSASKGMQETEKTEATDSHRATEKRSTNREGSAFDADGLQSKPWTHRVAAPASNALLRWRVSDLREVFHKGTVYSAGLEIDGVA